MPMQIMDLIAVNYDPSSEGNKPTYFHSRVSSPPLFCG